MDIERIFLRTNIKDNTKYNTKDNKNDIYETSSEYISSDEKNKGKQFIKKKIQPVIINQNLVIIKK